MAIPASGIRRRVSPQGYDGRALNWVVAALIAVRVPGAIVRQSSGAAAACSDRESGPQSTLAFSVQRDARCPPVAAAVRKLFASAVRMPDCRTLIGCAKDLLPHPRGGCIILRWVDLERRASPSGSRWAKERGCSCAG